MKTTNTPPAMSLTLHGAPRLFRHEKAHENGRGCDTKRPLAGQIARVIGWGVLAVFIALTGDAYAMEFAVQNRTTSARTYEVHTLSPLYVDQYGDSVRETSDTAYFDVPAGAVHRMELPVAQFVVLTTPQAVMNINGCTHATTVFVSDTGNSPAAAVFGKGQYVSSAGGTGIGDADTEAMTAGFAFALVLGFGFLLMWVFRRMHGNINHNQP